MRVAASLRDSQERGWVSRGRRSAGSWVAFRLGVGRLVEPRPWLMRWVYGRFVGVVGGVGGAVVWLTAWPIM